MNTHPIFCTGKRSATHRRRAFSLVEMLVVICIVGLVAGGSMFFLSGPLKRAEKEANNAALLELLQWTSDQSKRQKRGKLRATSLRFDFENQKIESKTTDRNRSINFESHSRIQALLIDGAVIDSGTLELDFLDGGSKSFALLVRGQGQFATGQWHLYCGPTGVVQSYGGSKEIENALRSQLASWANAN